MAKTGKCTLTCSSQSAANNTSTVTVAGIITTTGESYRGNERTGVYEIRQGGTVIKTGSFTHGAPANATTTLFSVSVTVNHKSDGSSDLITASYSYDGGWCAGSGSLSLDDIPRKSTLTSNNATLGPTGSQTLTITEKAAAFSHKLKYKCGSVEGYILGSASATSTALSVDWYPPLSLASQNTTGNSVSIKLILETYSGTTLVGSSEYTRSFNIPSDVKPGVSITVSDAAGYLSTYGAYVQGKSKLKIVVTTSESYGASVDSCDTNVDGKNYSVKDFTTDVVMNSGTLTITVTAKDSRGRSTVATKTITVLPYAAPKVTAIRAYRSDANGNASKSGAYLTVLFSSSVSPLTLSGSNKNTATYKVAYKKKTDASYPTPASIGYANNFAVSDGKYTFSATTTSSYDIQLTITDKFGTETVNVTGGSIKKFISFLYEGMGIALGKIAELANTFECALDAKFTGKVYLNNTDISGMADFIIEQGTASSWMYRKWNSGVYECWRRYSYGSKAMTTATGNVYYGTLTSLAFPITFTEIPTVEVSPESAGGYAFAVSLRNGTNSIDVSKTHTGTVYVYSPSSTTQVVVLNYYVRGKWK